MARLTPKKMSQEHEGHVAKVFHGKAEAASGANPTRPGDVYVREGSPMTRGLGQPLLIECKVSESGRVSITFAQIKKIREEAALRGCRPMVSLRLRDPHNDKRHVNVVLKLEDDELSDLEFMADER